jgi:hypothetical protein
MIASRRVSSNMMERPIRGRTRYPPAQDSGTARIGVLAVSGPDWRQLHGGQETR